MPASVSTCRLNIFRVLWLLTVAALGACSSDKPEPELAQDTPGAAYEQEKPQEPAVATAPVLSTKAQFWDALETLCEKSYPGQLTIGTEESDRDFGYAQLSMHVKRCRKNAIDIGLSVDEDDSRTWMLRRDDEQLSLHHQHLGENGKPDETSGYGGVSADEGTAKRQTFPADENTGEMIPAAATNVWAIEIVPGILFAYELQRVEEQRMFRVVFDLREPLQAGNQRPKYGR